MKSTGGFVACIFALLAPAVCQTDFQDVPAISALNCSNITDFMDDSSALFGFYNPAFTCDFTCEMAEYETPSFTPSPTSALYSEVETLPFRMTVTHRGEANMDCGMSCWSGNSGSSEVLWSSSPGPTAWFQTQTGIIVGSTPPISATPPATEGTSKLLPLMPLYTPTPDLSLSEYSPCPPFSEESNSDVSSASPSPVVSSMDFPGSDSSFELTPSKAMKWDSTSVIDIFQTPLTTWEIATKETKAQGASEPSTPLRSGSLARSYSSPALMQTSDEEDTETFVISPQPGTPDSYSIQVTGHPTTVQDFASGSTYIKEWPVFSTTNSPASSEEDIAILEPTTTQEPAEEVNRPNTYLEQLEKAAVVATFAGIKPEEWDAVEPTFRAAIAEQAGHYCTRQLAACGVSSRNRRANTAIQFHSNQVVVLPGYPILAERGLEVAFSLLLPQGPKLLMDAALLEVLTIDGKNYIDQHMGKEMVGVQRLIHNQSTTPPQLPDSVAAGIAVGTVAGCSSAAGIAIVLFRMRRHIRNFWNRFRHRQDDKPEDIPFTDIGAGPTS